MQVASLQQVRTPATASPAGFRGYLPVVEFRMIGDFRVALHLARATATLLLFAGLCTPASASPPLSKPVAGTLAIPVAARTCKEVSSCEEAVRLWCGGYRRADGDGDGIPCENVCRTKEQVDRIRTAIGC